MRIGFDVDDVLADLMTEWLGSYNRKHSTKWKPSDITQWEFQRDLGCSTDEIMSHLQPSLYDTVKPFPGALEVVTALRNLGHQIIYITTCPDAKHWDAKFWWLNHYGFYRKGDEAYPVGKWCQYPSKAAVGAERLVDWLVDDSVANVEEWPGVAYLYVQPHNNSSITRVKRLKKLEDLMLEVKHASTSLTIPVLLAAGPQGWKPPEQALLEQGLIPPGAQPSLKPTNPKDAIGSDKLPLHLWPSSATVWGTLGMLDGALKYGRNNFQEVGVRATIYIDAIERHLKAYKAGEDVDPDSGIHPLGHLLASAAILVEAINLGNLTDDRDYKGEGYLNAVKQSTPHVKRLKAKHKDKSPKHFTKASR